MNQVYFKSEVLETEVFKFFLSSKELIANLGDLLENNRIMDLKTLEKNKKLIQSGLLINPSVFLNLGSVLEEC